MPGVSGDGKGWRLPSKDDWKAMFVGCLAAATGAAPVSVDDTDINISNFRSIQFTWDKTHLSPASLRGLSVLLTNH